MAFCTLIPWIATCCSPLETGRLGFRLRAAVGWSYRGKHSSTIPLEGRICSVLRGKVGR